MSEFSEDAEIFGSAKFETIEALLDGFQLGSATSNIPGYFGCFLDSNSRFLGTDPHENWSAGEFLVQMKPYFASTPCAWRYDPIGGKRQISYVGENMATFDELLSSESFLATTRGSGSAIRRGKYWFITQYYLSFPIPNDLAKSFCATIARWEGGTITKKDAEKKAKQAADELLAELDEADNAKSNMKGKAKKSK